MGERAGARLHLALYLVRCSSTSKPLQNYIALTQDQPKLKSWDFPKGHLIRDIKSKGATRHYNTKPNKKIHGSLKKICLRRTNFKNVENQVL